MDINILDTLATCIFSCFVCEIAVSHLMKVCTKYSDFFGSLLQLVTSHFSLQMRFWLKAMSVMVTTCKTTSGRSLLGNSEGESMINFTAVVLWV